MNIEYHPAIEHELAQIRDYYEARADGLGDEFLNELERRIFQIAATPERWRLIDRDIRKALMRRFPYGVYFRIISEDRVRVLVIKHENRHPAFGLHRH